MVQSLLQVRHDEVDSRESMLRLWVHEIQRIFGDRMWDRDDRQWLQRTTAERLTSAFGVTWEELFHNGEVPPFTSFVRDVEDPPYEAIDDVARLKERAERALEDYGLESGNVPMDLVLFKDALHHLCRIHRIITQPTGHPLLVGIGGSGRKSLARLAAYLAGQQVFVVEITKNYREVRRHVTSRRHDVRVAAHRSNSERISKSSIDAPAC